MSESMSTIAEGNAIAWSEDVDKALADSKQSNKPLLLDFTAAPA